ncbi:MAG: ATP-binding cassette domain-containing protein [Bacilli bacterium]|nr:ATP-binding cassette domain-containing protein [Bacilli bacterium]
MIELRKIVKTYGRGEDTLIALNEVSLSFADKGLISIVGPSGCGKSTLLNVIGGLDRYDSGDILVDGVSTKDYGDSDWDSYRNHRIGFIFQSYSLIPHLSVLDNVMMALTLSGDSSSTSKKEKALAMLEKVGLKEKAKKRPSQLSGGQMQRVAIARALINNPDILLCDEPTGALDSKTSIQVMDILKEISKERLVVMVTHNNDIASTYSTRIVEMLDGKIIGEETPTEEVIATPKERKKPKGTSMSFLSALKSSAKNLLTKKGRTIATSIAGSIGLIGIGLVLSLSSGINASVSSMESTTLSGFPITISSSATTFEYLPSSLTESSSREEFISEDIYYADTSRSNINVHINNFSEEFLAYLKNLDPSTYNSLTYSYGVAVNLAYQNGSNYGLVSAGSTNLLAQYGVGNSSALFELPDSKDFILSQYDVLAGSYPSSKEDLVLIVDSKNQLSDTALNALGIPLGETYSSSDFLGKTYKVLSQEDYYQKEGSTYKGRTDYETLYKTASSTSIDAKISAILRIKKSSSSSFLSTGLGYPAALTRHLLDLGQTASISLAQKDSPEVNVLTGTAFDRLSTYEGNMALFGYDSTPSSISIYPKSFEDKATIKAYIDSYNKDRESKDKIIYSDLAESITGVLTNVTNIIAVVLSAIAAISLIVSSVMIAIIIYVSVIERTQEIGIMRALGARKKDITRIFSMEALSIGLVSGLIGVIATYLLDFPVSFIVTVMLGESFSGFLPPQYALLLLLISLILTFLAGIFPALFASKKDPVTALREN